MVKDSLKTLLNSFPWFFNKSEDSNFYKSQEVSNRRLQDLYQSLFEVYNSFHLGKKCLIWKDQSEPYNYQINFVANFPHLKTVTCLKNDAVIYSEHYEYEDNVDSFLYIYDSLLDNDTSDENVEESETETQEIPIIPQDTFKIIIETYEEYIITKGFPENDEEQGNEFDHDISLDEIGAQNNIPRKTYKITDDYENTEPPYNDRLSEDDYHYMNRIINYVLRIHNTPLPVVEIWKEYGIFSDMINREQYLFKMFDEKVHPDPDWVPMPWEHKDRLCELTPNLGQFFFVSANTLVPVLEQPVRFNFKYLNSLAEDLTGKYNVTIYLNDDEEPLISNYTGAQYTVSSELLEEDAPNNFVFIAYNDDVEFATEELTVIVRGCNTADWYVSPNGDDDNDGKTNQTPFETIEKALTMVNGEENLIVCMSGTHTINKILNIPTSCTILGCGNSIIDNTDGLKFFNILQNRELTLQNLILRYSTSTGVISNAVFENNNLSNNGLYVMINEGAGKTSTILTLSTDKSTYTIGETIEVTGSLTDDEHAALTGKSIKIYVNNRLVDTVETQGNAGNFSKDITANISGAVSIKAVFEGDEDYYSNNATENITVNKKATTITFNASKSSYDLGETITLSGSLKTGTTGLDDVDVKIYDGETLLDTVTTDNGTFDKTLTASIVSSKTYKAVYEGDATYDSATSSDVNVSIVKRTSTISLLTSSASVITGDSYTLSGALLYNGSGLGSVNIKLYDGNTLLDTLTTGNDGTFSKSITSSVAGTFSYKVVYEGDATYNNVESSIVNVVVSDRPAPASITVSSDKPIMMKGETATITAKVLDANGNPCVGETVSFEVVNGESLGSDVTDSSGEASVYYLGKGVGDLSIKAECRLLIQTCIICDAWKYDDASSNKVSQYTKFGSPTLEYNTNGYYTLKKQSGDNWGFVTPYNTSITTNDDVSIEMTIVSAGMFGAVGLYKSDTVHLPLTYYPNDHNVGIYGYGSTNNWIIPLETISTNAPLKLKFELKDGVINVYVYANDGTLVWSKTNVSIPSTFNNANLKLVVGDPNHNSSSNYVNFKNVIIKPL